MLFTIIASSPAFQILLNYICQYNRRRKQEEREKNYHRLTILSSLSVFNLFDLVFISYNYRTR